MPKQWPKTLQEEWKVSVGEGVASPVVVGSNVYVFNRQKGDEFTLCFDLASGQEKWRSEPYSAPFKPGPGDGFNIGPRATPAVAQGRVFALGICGIVSCLDAKTGKLLWRKDYQPYYQRSGNSPLVVDGLCIAQLGADKNCGLRALDAVSGEVKWCFDVASPAPGSPILVDLAGERQVVMFTGWDLLGVSLATGKLLWQTPLRHGYFENCVSPVRYRDLLIAGGRMEPPRAFRLEKGDKGIAAKEIWKAKSFPSYMSTPVVVGDWLFGHADQKMGQLYCLDAKTGETLWDWGDRLGGYASILKVGSICLVLTDKGRLYVIKPNAKECERIAEYKVSDNSTWAHPVFLGDRLLIRDDNTLRSFRIDPNDVR
jgi:outer membrane protein assembly factor BamB